VKKFIVAGVLSLGLLAGGADQAVEAHGNCSSDVGTRAVQSYCTGVDHHLGFRVVGYARRPGSSNTLLFYGPFVTSGHTSSVTIPSSYWNLGYKFYGLMVDYYHD
jgi:hypothetical protein